MSDEEFDEFEELAQAPEEMEAPPDPQPPEPEAEAAPEATEPEPVQAEQADQPADADADKPAPAIPPWRLRQETEKRREIQAELNELRSWREQQERRWQEINAQQAEPALPSPEEDVFGHARGLQARMEAIEQRDQQRQQEAAELSQQQQQYQQFTNRIQQDEHDFVQTKPDYYNALNYGRAIKRQELSMAGYQMSDIEQIIGAEEIQMAQQAYQMGRNPAEVLYERSQYWGYGKNPENGGETNGGGKSAAPTEAQQKLDRIAAAQEANQSLSSAGGSPEGTGVSLQTIDAMSEEEFNVWIAKDGNEAKWQKLMSA